MAVATATGVDVLDAATLAQRATLADAATVTAPAQSLSPDGRTLAAGIGDGTVRLFDVASQQPLGAALPGRAYAPAC